MAYAPISDDYDLDLLDEHLSSPERPDDAMLLSELDGYLTAIALSPGLIPPSEWLPAIWGGEGLPFAGAKEAGGAFAAIMGLYNDNLRDLADRSRPYEPLFIIDRDGSTFADIWAQGFFRGVGLRLEEWRPLIEDKQAFDAYAPIAILSTDRSELPEVSDKRRDKISRSAPQFFPDCIAQIQAFWRNRGLGPRSAAPPRVGTSPKSAWMARQRAAWAENVAPLRSAKVGRNDPCPCGSGKKYKRCCGA
ncbi:UPF0149 family protein [Reyranella sp.]|uniref:UPF0149 family protein n=1 Tax=Reyranella sp. TaxID=1929291 RepID=UPI0025E5DECC|nr:UPF0149 family protein [Reyranella sp.]